MIIDAHTHIFFPEARKDRSNYMLGEEAFKLIYSNEKARMASVEELVKAMDKDGVDRSVTFGFPWRTLYTAARANDYVLEAMQTYPDRIIGFACAYPEGKGSQKELDRCLSAGMKGVGELAFYTGRLSAEDMLEIMKPVLEVCKDHQAPLMLHANENVGHTYPGKSEVCLGELYRFLKAIAPHPVILAHWGGGLFFYELMKKEVTESLAHVIYDTAASPFLYRSRIYSLAVEICGEKRIALGSDFPLIPVSRYFAEMEEAGLSADIRNRICGANLQELLGL